MSILIKGMEMPTTCVQCRFRCYDPYREPSDGLGKGTNVCWFTQEEIWNTQRGEQCPLIELPPHGDLIDRDAYAYPGDLMDEPVIIPADPAEEGEA